MSSCLVLNKEDIYISLQDTIDVGAEQGPAATIVIQEGIKKLINCPYSSSEAYKSSIASFTKDI